MSSPITLPELVQRRRTSIGLSIRQGAALVGCSPSTLSRVETGLQTPSPALLRSLASMLGLDLRELYELAEYPLPDDLPNLRPYIRMKYKNLPPRAFREIESFVEFLHVKYGVADHGSRGGTDEYPDGAPPLPDNQARP